MTILNGDAAIQRFKENEERLDSFLNQPGTYTTNEAVPRMVETIPALMLRIAERFNALHSKGPWQTGTVYQFNDTVVESNTVYFCLVGHTSGVFATDLTALNWAIYEGVSYAQFEAFATAVNETLFNHTSSINANTSAVATKAEDADVLHKAGGETVAGTLGITGKLSANGGIDVTGDIRKDGALFTGGAKGGGANAVFYENDQVVTEDYTVPGNKNAGSFGPVVSIATGKAVTLASGANWLIVDK